ncbi:MAG: DNA repair protein RecN [Armatimonadetes bacterium]|nr:DNA repair protein RecN [Armatimonadota bacterium]
MIVELSAENVAILDKALLSLGPGFTVLTGETGAGKSLLIDAIELALGARGDSDLVRSGCSRATVNLTVDLSARPDLVKALADLGHHLEDSLLFIQREVFAEGRSQGRIQGKLSPVSALKQVGQLLVDLHGQHDHQSLLHPERHVEFLDAWVGEPAQAALSQVADSWQAFSQLERRLAALRTGRREREQRADMLRYQVAEIEEAAPAIGESAETEALLSRLTHAQRLRTSVEEALEALSRREGSAQEAIGSATRQLGELVALDAEIDACLLPLREAGFLLDEALERLRAYAEGIEADPKRLQDLADRLETLKRLRRKYGETDEEVLAFLARAKEELGMLEDDSEGEEALRERTAEAREAHRAACVSLTSLRMEGSTTFCTRVADELRDLAMVRAQFGVSVTPKEPDATGADAIEFAFSANLGEPMRPLAKIASGGEMARLMLALKTALAGKAGVPTLIFDEVEAGLGGPTASVVGKKLEELGRQYQVIVISHLPQIAGRAGAHYRIEKTESGGRVATSLRALSPSDRVEEIARMLAGEEIGETARAHAVELLAAIPD